MGISALVGGGAFVALSWERLAPTRRGCQGELGSTLGSPENGVEVVVSGGGSGGRKWQGGGRREEKSGGRERK